jgi:hypothetical protein
MRGNKQLVRYTLSTDAMAHTNNREDDIDLHGSVLHARRSQELELQACGSTSFRLKLALLLSSSPDKNSQSQ